MLINSFKDKKILITGASKGLGLEIAKTFEKDGAQLILIARSKELLDKLCNNFNDPALVMISSDGTALVSNCGPAGCPRIAVNNVINDKSRSQKVSRK